MTSSFKITADSVAEDVLNLPKGRLMIGELVADFSPENVVEAARNIAAESEHSLEEYSFVTQAGVIAHAANHCSWNNRPEYKPI